MSTTGLTITDERGTVDVPREIEAEGGAAVQAYVDAQLGAAAAPVTPATSAPVADPEE